MPLASLPALLAMLPFQAGADDVAGDLCGCLASPKSAALAFKRIRGTGVSFEVPADATGGAHTGMEGEGIVWTDRKVRIVATYMTDMGAPRSALHGCELSRRTGKVAIGRTDDGLLADFGFAPGLPILFTLEVRSRDADAACRTMSRAVDSAMWVGDWRKMVVLSISPDLRSFTFRDEAGLVQRAKMRDRLTPTGQVSAIRPDAIEMIELEPLPEHRWREVPVTIPLTR